jgi:hypothetical protein
MRFFIYFLFIFLANALFLFPTLLLRFVTTSHIVGATLTLYISFLFENDYRQHR